MDNGQGGEEHVPSPFAWTEEQRRRFALVANYCPMCQYKFQYAELDRLGSYAASMEEDTPEWEAMMGAIAQKTHSLLALGLVIAGEQCDRNTRTYQAVLN